MKKRQIGILGGTFDPIHVGHLVTADFVMNSLALEKVIFIPTGYPPHKDAAHMATPHERYIMTVLATGDNPYFSVSDIEVASAGVAYTIDTLRKLNGCYKGGADFYFIVGTDAVAEIPNWENAHGLLRYCRFVAATRPGFASAVEKVWEFFGDEGRERIIQLDTPELEISSTDIRDRVRNGRSFKYIVPASVELYIKKEGLYLT
ncbi:MAG: nicotinate-nucleotide adenylyltransferase [Acidaminococcales bacterium]|jgi:nicotinate-nucleotide adenylyltransferase|nr:nicotinate-nucleotide adenylyltransferase [Acidaminococcales bacterium]